MYLHMPTIVYQATLKALQTEQMDLELTSTGQPGALDEAAFQVLISSGAIHERPQMIFLTV